MFDSNKGMQLCLFVSVLVGIRRANAFLVSHYDQDNATNLNYSLFLFDTLAWLGISCG
jgi:hypothetical protein